MARSPSSTLTRPSPTRRSRSGRRRARDPARSWKTAESLDATVQWRDEVFTLRYVLTHMIEEYARHIGHADLLRERIDGATGE
nr:DUF664 domain-containing protein [Streptomyces sp. NRRL F-5122]